MTARFRRSPILGAILALAALAGPALAAGDASPAEAAFTPAQRAEITAILRQALISDPSILRDAIAALRAQDEANRAGEAADLIKAHAAALFDTPGDPIAGNLQGRITLVEFYDLRCPYCRSMAPAMDRLLATDHEVRVIYKDLPILGPQSVLGARAVLAAARQGGYDRLQGQLLATSEPITEALLQRLAGEDKLDWPRLAADMNAPEVTERIAANLALAHALGVQGTPALVVGDRLIPGATDLAGLRQLVAGAEATH